MRVHKDDIQEVLNLCDETDKLIVASKNAVERIKWLENENKLLKGLLLDMRQHQGSIQQYIARIDAALL